MKKIKVILLTFLVFTQVSTLLAGGIEFQNSTFSEALKMAAESKKLIFIDAYTTWCGPCKAMAKNIFTKDEVAKFYNSNFICLKIEMEKGEGLDIAKKYDVQVYPTFLFINADGEKVHQACGSKSVELFIADGQNALNPETQLISLKRDYESGKNEFNFSRRYAHALYNANMDATEIINGLAASSQATELINEQDFALLTNNSLIDSKAFQFIMQNKPKYVDIVGDEKIREFIEGSFLTAANKAGKKEDMERLSNSINSLHEYELGNAKELELHMNYIYAIASKKNIMEAAQPYIENFKMKDAGELNNIAWTIFENYNDRENLLKATEWARLSTELEKDYANMDTYANLLYKIGKEKEAIEVAKESINLGKAKDIDTGETEALLKKIESKQK
jgi:thiol-disulfide isomerase/thioredoxin